MTQFRSVRRSVIILALQLAVGAGTVGAGESVTSRPDSPFGIHGPPYSHWLHARRPYLWTEGDAFLRVWRETGAAWARQDFWWSLCEPEPGVLRWEDFDRAVATYERAGARVLAILCYASAWSGGASPQTDEQRQQFAHYVSNMVQRYRGRVAAWEVWNEPNIQPFWEPRPSSELYAKLLIAAYAAAKQADPHCLIVGGALAGPDAEFLEGMYQHGAAGHFDALSYHNYGQESDITTEWPAVEKLREVMRKHGDGDKPLWHTETGFFTGPAGLPERQQASRIVRYSVGLLAMGIEKTFQLTLADWTDDPTHPDLSVYRGLTHADYSVKPSYGAYQTMCRRLGDKKLVAAIRPAPGVSGYLFAPRPLAGAGESPTRPAAESEPTDQSVLVMWRDDVGEPAATRVNLGSAVILSQQLDGSWRIHRDPTGVHELLVGPEPVYVISPGVPVWNQRLVRWPNPVLTRISRSAQARMEVEVTNPDAEPLQLVVHPPGAPSAGWVLGEVPARSTANVQAELDASGLDVGRHEWRWTLVPKGGDRPLAEGFRVVEVLSPLRILFDRFNRLRAGAPTLPVRVEYTGTQAAPASIGMRLAGKPCGAPVRLDLEPARTVTVDLPLDLAAFADGRPVLAEVAIEAQGLKLTAQCTRPLLQCPRAPKDARADGDLGEWTSREPQIRPTYLRWENVNAPEPPGPDDLSVMGWVAYDERGLWVAVEVKDDVRVPPQSRAVWNWDSIQVGLDLASDAQPNGGYDDNDLEVELGRAADGTLWCYLGACPVGWPQEELSARLVGAVRSDEKTGRTAYELLIPASLIASVTALEPDTVLGFSILVNDNDAQGRAGWQELTPGIGLGKSPAHFAWLWLR